MRSRFVWLAAGLAVAVGVLARPLSSSPSATLIDRVGWLSGCWEQRSGTSVVEEQWMSPKAASMLSVGRTTRGGSLVDYEFVLLTERSGQLAYEAHPSSQPSATFTAVDPTDTMVVFANPTHDFPQHVGYRRLGGDSLLAWIDGTHAGKTKRIEFPYQRVACASR